MSDGIFLNLIQWRVDDYLPKKTSPAQKKKFQNIYISTVIISEFLRKPLPMKKIQAQPKVEKKLSCPRNLVHPKCQMNLGTILRLAFTSRYKNT